MSASKWDSSKIDKRFMALLEEAFPTLNFGRVSIQTSGFPIRIMRRLHAAGMVIGHRIFIAPEYYNLESAHGLGLIAHELKHVEQHERTGNIPHAIRYAIDFVKHGCRYSQDLPLEKEAYEFERDITRKYMRILACEKNTNKTDVQ